MQTDRNYLRQYTDNGLFLDLSPVRGGIIDTDPLPENGLQSGELDGQTTGIATATNAWGLYTNPTLLEHVGVDDFAGGTWDAYAEWMAEVTDAAAAAGIELWGGTEWPGRIQNFEIQLRAQGKDLFTEAGEANFTEDEIGRAHV